MPVISSAAVTGASGFVGSYFLPQLISAFPQLSVIACGRSAKPDALTANLVTHVPLDLSKPVDIEFSPNVVFHIGGEKKDEAKMWDVNVGGTRRMVDWAGHQGTKRFVYLSSVGVYGAGKNAGVVREDTPKDPQNLYERSKSAAEDWVREQCPKYGMEYVILQPSNVIGLTGGESYPLLGMMRSIQKGLFTYFGDGTTWFNFVAVEDVAGGLAAAVSPSAANGTFILNSPVQLSQVVAWLADALGVDRPQRKLPAALGLVAGEVGSFLARVTDRSLPFDRARFDELTKTTHYDGSRIVDATGFSYPLGIEVALRTMVGSYADDGRL